MLLRRYSRSGVGDSSGNRLNNIVAKKYFKKNLQYKK